MEYIKPALSITDQLIALQHRGLTINDLTQAERFLNNVSYFRFAAYLRIFEQPDRSFRAGSTFEQVAMLYTFDVELRKLLLGAVQRIEIALRSRVIHEFSLSHGVLRNHCAHHARVWNRYYPNIPKLPPVLHNAWINVSGIAPYSLYAILCCIAYWLRGIDPQTTFVADMKALLAKYPTISPSAMGFPKGWRQEPLWQ